MVIVDCGKKNVRIGNITMAQTMMLIRASGSRKKCKERNTGYYSMTKSYVPRCAQL